MGHVRLVATVSQQDDKSQRALGQLLQYCLVFFRTPLKDVGSTHRSHSPPTDLCYNILLRGMAAIIEGVAKKTRTQSSVRGDSCARRRWQESSHDVPRGELRKTTV
jgi:hypothetical protein